MNTDLIKGFKDFTGEEAEKRKFIKSILVETFEKYGFEPAETPVIENEEFVRGENKGDEAISEIYTLKDKGNRNLALRYEFTFQLDRISKSKKLPYKRYQIGEVFRDEPTNSKRVRQITQCDLDIVGSTIRDEAEVLSIANEVLSKLRIKNEIYIGNRALLNEIMDDEGITKNKEERNQIMREIDKLDKIKEEDIMINLKKFKAEKLINIFKEKEKYFEKYKNYEQIKKLKEYCSFYGFNIIFQPSLVRGLSYYNGNVWEIKTKEMRESICGGGSYLVNDIQSTGISFGLERLSILFNSFNKKEKILVLSLNQDEKAIKFSQKLRDKGKNVVIFYGKPTKALDYANSYKINEVIFIGEEEVKKGKAKIKNMQTGKENFIDL
ncbi:histidine--tRNA ligase [Candidatus Woesearchaeota archaeon]|jgi:histidyl-tRNA synthetase|nr:histidine--tRNA ligase [Candidatus Woesearchaeota archaeon]